MDEQRFPALAIVPYWRKLNDELIRLVDYVPDEKINYSPRRELWNFRGILLHIADARDGWMSRAVKDAVDEPNVWQTVRSKIEIQRSFARTWERAERFLRDPAKLDATVDRQGAEPRAGHWVAFHLLEHDIHHRADVLHYLAMLGIETPDVGAP